MKQLGKKIIVAILGWQLRRLRQRHHFKVVAVAGSIGKTSTKFAVASLLAESFRVRFQSGNYNDQVTVPLVFFGQSLPSLLNPIAWTKTLISNERQIRGSYAYDVVVVEVGTDGPGQIAQFAEYLHVDIGVVTAITPEHMEFFDSLDAVASEELSLATFSDKLVVNADLCAVTYLSKLPQRLSYGIHQESIYQIKNAKYGDQKYEFSVYKGDQSLLGASHPSISEMQLYSILAAVSIADQFGMTADEITKGIARIQPVSGRLQLLEGFKNSTIIDDTYNASPEAVKAALDTLYSLPAPQKIALLGNMNELGNYSPEAHREVGEYCNPKKLDLVVTLGVDANQYLAATAEDVGCRVIRALTPSQAADAIKSVLKPGAIILAKGSQNGVFAEEAVKQLLVNPSDARKLVRQSPAWLKKKAKNFS